MGKHPEPTLPAPDLDDFLCFSIYSTGHAFNRVYRRQLERVGLTYPQYLVMVALWSQDNVTIGHIGNRLFMDSSTLTPMIKRMEAMGLLSRTRDPADERRVLVALTDRGRAVQREAGDIMRHVADATGMGNDGTAALRREILALRRRLDQYEAGQAGL